MASQTPNANMPQKRGSACLDAPRAQRLDAGPRCPSGRGTCSRPPRARLADRLEVVDLAVVGDRVPPVGRGHRLVAERRDVDDREPLRAESDHSRSGPTSAPVSSGPRWASVAAIRPAIAARSDGSPAGPSRPAKSTHARRSPIRWAANPGRARRRYPRHDPVRPLSYDRCSVRGVDGPGPGAHRWSPLPQRRTCVKILVTGGAGFIGHHLVRGLLARGDEVTVIDDLSTGFRSRLDAGPRLDQVRRGQHPRSRGARPGGGRQRGRSSTRPPSRRSPGRSSSRSVSNSVNAGGTIQVDARRRPARGPTGRLRRLVVGLRHPADAALRRDDEARPALAVRCQQDRRRAVPPHARRRSTGSRPWCCATSTCSARARIRTPSTRPSSPSS